MPANPSDESSAEPPAFFCAWRRQGSHAAAVSVSGELDIATSAQLAQALREALRHARLVLLDLHEMSFIDLVGRHVIVDLCQDARKAGSRLLIVGLSEQANTLFAMTETHATVDILPTHEPDRSGAASLGSAVRCLRDEDGVEGAGRRMSPLDNPVNARVLSTRAMAIADLAVWLHSQDGRVFRAWVPQSTGVAVPAGTPIEVYLDRHGHVNGWMDRQSGLAVNQRRRDRATPATAAAAVACQGACGVVWQAPAAVELANHAERCLTCAGPLALR